MQKSTINTGVAKLKKNNRIQNECNFEGVSVWIKKFQAISKGPKAMKGEILRIYTISGYSIFSVLKVN